MIPETGLPLHVHIVGIGGAATSGLAKLLSSHGHVVSGSDRDASLESSFKEHGIQFYRSHHAEHLASEIELVIRSAAVPEGNPEVEEARRRGMSLMLYSECLGHLSTRRNTIAVAGTHGKTSTTGILTSIFLAAQLDPTVVLGGELDSIGGRNWRKGAGPDFIVEACEFQRSFLALQPSCGIITNIELDHPEIYDDLDHVEETFCSFLKRFRPGSPVVIPYSLADRLLGAGEVKPIYFGIGDGAGWRGQIDSKNGERAIEIREDGVFRFSAKLNIPGTHAVLNTTAATALAASLGVGLDQIRRGIEEFCGVKRRFEKRDVLDEVDWYEDYAHHPTEIQYTLAGARELFPGRKIWALFQPHQATRFDAFLEQFSDSFFDADEVIVLPIYSVREDRRDFPVDLRESLVRHLRLKKVKARTLGFDQAIHDLPELVSPGDVVVSLGAGSNSEIGDSISMGRSGVTI